MSDEVFYAVLAILLGDTEEGSVEEYASEGKRRYGAFVRYLLPYIT